MLDLLARSLRGTPAQRLEGARLALRLSFVVLALPGLPLGGLYLLSRPAPLTLPAALGLLMLGTALGLLPLLLAGRAATSPRLPDAHRGLTAALQAGSAPAVPFLLGCACLTDWPLTLALWAAAWALYRVAWQRLPGWLTAQPRL